jgi:hypothetical protein
MSVLLDDQPMGPGEIAPSATVAQVIESVRTKLKDGRIVLGLRCEGVDVAGERLNDVLSRPAGSFGRLEVITGSAHEAVRDALEHARRAFGASFAIVQEAVTAISAGNLADAMQRLVECAGLWGQTHEAVVAGGRLLGLDFTLLEIDGRRVLAWLEDLAGRLRELKQAIESRDHVALGDLLRYEMDETLRGWERMLEGFIGVVDASAGRVMSPAGSPSDRVS